MPLSRNKVEEQLRQAENNLATVKAKLGDKANKKSPSLRKAVAKVTDVKEGEYFRDHCRSLLTDWTKLTQGLKNHKTQAKGYYVLGCHSSVALYSLPDVLPQLLQYHGLTLELRHDLSRVITEQVINHQVDFGIVVNPVKHNDLVIVKLMDDEVSIFVKQSIKPPPVIFYDPSLIQARSVYATFVKSSGLELRQVKSSSLELIGELVARGAGYGILPARVAKQIKTATLKKIHQDAPMFRDQICLVYRADQLKSMGHKVILKTLKKNLREVGGH